MDGGGCGAGQRAVVVGAGLGGLTAALELAHAGWDVTLCEAADRVGGKAHRVAVGGREVDGGPTVFTMAWVFEALFRAVGARFEEHVRLTRADLLARHAWPDGARLDLFADRARSEAAIAALSGRAEAARFRALSERAGRIYRTLAPRFIEAQKPGPLTIARAIGPSPRAMRDLAPTASLWQALRRELRDPRLMQLFGRYATYVGGSPFQSPALLMLIWHVEEAGVWHIEGGMGRLARAIAALAEARGAEIRTGAPVAEITARAGRTTGVRLATGEAIAADAVVFNGDASALAGGLMGSDVCRAVDPVPEAERSLSALTLTGLMRPRGFPLAPHTVFFSSNYAREFAEIARDGLPSEPTVYLCAQDRGGAAPVPEDERVLVIINAAARGDCRAPSPEETDRCLRAAHDLLARSGLEMAIQPGATITGPAEWHRRFPGSGGAIYGRSPHGSLNGAFASFRRPGARSRMPGLYLAGGTVHPGAGVPMATLSGRLAAAAAMADLGVRRRARASM